MWPFWGLMYYAMKELPRIYESLEASDVWREHASVFTVSYPEHVVANITLVMDMERSEAPDNQMWIEDVRLEMLRPESAVETP